MMSRVLSLIGFGVFVAAFFLPGVKEAGSASSDRGIPGYLCAYATLALPWTADGTRMLHQEPVKFFAILISGWISPVFVITFVLLLINPNNRLAGALRILLLLMFVACWVVFYNVHLYPRAGYFLWTGAMLLTLFATKLFPSPARPQPVHIG
jgi:hypothetical protein